QLKIVGERVTRPAEGDLNTARLVDPNTTWQIDCQIEALASGRALRDFRRRSRAQRYRSRPLHGLRCVLECAARGECWTGEQKWNQNRLHCSHLAYLAEFHSLSDWTKGFRRLGRNLITGSATGTMGSLLKALMVHGACCEFHVILTGWMRGGTRETQTSLHLETDGDDLFPPGGCEWGINGSTMTVPSKRGRAKIVQPGSALGSADNKTITRSGEPSDSCKSSGVLGRLRAGCHRYRALRRSAY